MLVSFPRCGICNGSVASFLKIPQDKQQKNHLMLLHLMNTGDDSNRGHECQRN